MASLHRVASRQPASPRSTPFSSTSPAGSPVGCTIFSSLKLENAAFIFNAFYVHSTLLTLNYAGESQDVFYLFQAVPEATMDQ